MVRVDGCLLTDTLSEQGILPKVIGFALRRLTRLWSPQHAYAEKATVLWD